MPGQAFAGNPDTTGNRINGGRIGQKNRTEMVSGDKNCDFSQSLFRLGAKEVVMLNCRNGNVPTRIFRASPSLLVHTSTLFIELMLGATFKK